jgi:hypothetical protein
MGDMMGTGFWEAIGARKSEPTVWYHEDNFDTRVPCQHDAFSFQVTVREIWSRPGRPDDLTLAVVARREPHRATVRRRLRVISRSCPPSTSALLEHRANEELGRPEFVAGESGLTCACSFEVMPDEALVQQLQQAERDRLAAEASHEAMTRNLECLEHIKGRWADFLRQLSRDPLGPTVAQLAGSSELADAISRFAAQQEQITRDLRDLCDTATEAYREKGAYELVMNTDNAFSRLLSHINRDSAPSANGDGRNGHRPHPAQ